MGDVKDSIGDKPDDRKSETEVDSPEPQEQDKLQPETSQKKSETNRASVVEPLAPATETTDVELAQPNGVESKRPKSPKQKRIIKMLKRREVIFCMIGGITFFLGLILIIVALLIMQGKCEKQPYWYSENGDGHASFDASLAGQQGENDVEYHHHHGNETSSGNLAEGKAVYQSSTHTSLVGGYQYNASLAVDGDQGHRFSKGLCAQTENQLQPYWYVDLGGKFLVRHVKLVIPSDCCIGELHDFEVRIGMDEELGSNNLCKHFMGTALTVSLDINCDSLLYGRYVSIQMLGDAARPMDRLTLCEVKVFST